MRIQIADYVESGLFTKWIFYYQSEYVINHHWSNLLSERIFIIIASFTWANYWLSVRILITRANIYYQMISIIKASFSIIAHNFNRANVFFLPLLSYVLFIVFHPCSVWTWDVAALPRESWTRTSPTPASPPPPPAFTPSTGSTGKPAEDAPETQQELKEWS